MKRGLSLVLAAGTLALWIPQPMQAEGERIGFLVNLGFMTKENISPNWLTAGAEIGLPLGPGLSFNPEVTIWGSNFGFRSYYVVPGALANIRVGRFTFGAGAVWRYWHSRYAGGDSSEKIALKIQAGYLSGKSRIALVIIPLSTQDYISFGIALGLGF